MKYLKTWGLSSSNLAWETSCRNHHQSSPSLSILHLDEKSLHRKTEHKKIRNQKEKMWFTEELTKSNISRYWKRYKKCFLILLKLIYDKKQAIIYEPPALYCTQKTCDCIYPCKIKKYSKKYWYYCLYFYEGRTYLQHCLTYIQFHFASFRPLLVAVERNFGCPFSKKNSVRTPEKVKGY